MIELETQFEKLTKKEAEALHNLMRAKHGNVKACAEKTGLSVFTLRRAKERLDITPDTAKVIRESLLSVEPATA